ncbi:hypothetical protein GOBAR_AA16754 [Gossypium barbadense]|uniref:Homeobox domain-containing protein n=1 Tax=Gossypium barbadense TaxID=3634 RepID=A0A2P5XKR6_GOSBA|nr:hypothetical protein GOBAR_AA16754 [Gossypium barbadense]
MASALSVNSSISVRILQSSSYRGRVSIAQPRSFNLLPAPQSRRRYTVAFSRRRNNQPASTDKKKRLKKENKKGLVEEEEEDFEGDPSDFSFSFMKIKTLAAELCLDRAVVLELLREPPPELLMISATLPDEPVKKELEPEPEPEPMPETKHVETLAFETTMDNVKHEPKVKEPIHVMQQRWSAQKRLKKVQIDTLEKVYRRSKRPTNTMISSIVQVTNLPRKRVVKWFEDKRNEDGVPEHRQPYRRFPAHNVSTYKETFLFRNLPFLTRFNSFFAFLSVLPSTPLRLSLPRPQFLKRDHTVEGVVFHFPLRRKQQPRQQSSDSGSTSMLYLKNSPLLLGSSSRAPLKVPSSRLVGRPPNNRNTQTQVPVFAEISPEVRTPQFPIANTPRDLRFFLPLVTPYMEKYSRRGQLLFIRSVLTAINEAFASLWYSATAPVYSSPEYRACGTQSDCAILKREGPQCWN